MIEQRIRLLISRFDGQELLQALRKLAAETHSSADMAVVSKAILELLRSSSLVGYLTQAELVSLAASTEGAMYAINRVLPLVDVLVGRIESSLVGHPERERLFASLLIKGATLQGFTQGQVAAAETLQLTQKKWLHLGNPKEPRPVHLALHGVTLPADGLFTLGSGAQVLAPHDWSVPNPAAEWVNCSCQVVYVP